MSPARLRDDRRGSAALVPVFIILAVLVLATTVSVLMFTQGVAERTAGQTATAAASRSAVAAMTSELNLKPLDQIEAERAAAGASYVPESWIPTPHQTLHVTAITSPAPAVIEVTFTVDTPVSRTTAPVTVEYIAVVQRLDPDGWVDVPAGTPGAVERWVPARTITEAP